MEPETEKKITSVELVTDEQVRQVLLEDKGQDAQLESWKLVSFTKKGDNYACVVMSVEVKYSSHAQELEAFYVVKISPQGGPNMLTDMMNTIFTKEANFYLQLLPELNATLKSIGQPPLQFPRCIYASLEKSNERIYFEDLRKRNFKMFDRKKGMDVPHTSLVLKEIARLHAVSLLLEAKCSEPLEVKYDWLAKYMFSLAENARELMLPMIQGNIGSSLQILKKIGAHEKAIKWVEGLMPEIEDILTTQMRNGKYDVVCHGDCWNNNILFRYDSDGAPVEIMLLDLQVCRKSSPVSELNQFMYTSLTSEVRKPNLNNFLKIYHDSFKGVFNAGGSTMPFSEADISEEFRAKNKLGAVFSMMAIPIVLMESDDLPDKDIGEQDVQASMKAVREKAMAMVDKNPLVKPRFLSTFEEFMETGLIS